MNAIVGKTTRLTKEEFILRAREIHGWKYDYSKVEYVNNHTKVRIICPEHGEFWQKPSNHLSGAKCPGCANRIRNTTENFITKAKKVHGDKYDYSKADCNNSFDSVVIVCPEHGEFRQRVIEHLSGCGCQECGKEQVWEKRGRLTTDEWISKAREVHGDKYDYSKVEYTKNRSKVCIICPKHGEFWQKANNHLNGNGCPKCRNSYLERFVSNFLTNKNEVFEKEKTFGWLKNKGHLYYDFYLPKYNSVIECQGIQHYIPLKEDITKFNEVLENDKIKNKLSYEHGIRVFYFTHKCIYDDYCKNKENVFYKIEELWENITG